MQKCSSHTLLVAVCSDWCSGELCAAGLSISGYHLCTVTRGTCPTLRHHVPLYGTHHHQHKLVHSALLTTCVSYYYILCV